MTLSNEIGNHEYTWLCHVVLYLITDVPFASRVSDWLRVRIDQSIY